MAMTPKQQRFVEEYLIDLNATRAAIRAGYSTSGASVEGTRLLANANIASAVAAGRAAVSEHALVTASDVLRGLRREAELEGEGSSHSARVAAWGKLGEHLKLFTTKVENSGTLTNRVISGEPLSQDAWAAKYETEDDVDEARH